MEYTKYQPAPTCSVCNLYMHLDGLVLQNFMHDAHVNTMPCRKMVWLHKSARSGPCLVGVLRVDLVDTIGQWWSVNIIIAELLCRDSSGCICSESCPSGVLGKFEMLTAGTSDAIPFGSVIQDGGYIGRGLDRLVLLYCRLSVIVGLNRWCWFGGSVGL